MELRTYKYRLYPSRKQKERLLKSFEICKHIYNELLEISITRYRQDGRVLRQFDYDSIMSGRHPELYAQVSHNVSKRVSEAFKHFFHRIKDKSCKKKGFPRFKSRVVSITYPQARKTNGKRRAFWFINDKKIYASKIGNIPIVLHRIPKGRIKTLTIKQNKAGQWFATFACEMPYVLIKHPSVEKVGIDVGLESFATLSNGEVVNNPRFLVKAEKRLKLLQRRVSRKVKGSKNRGKARFKVARLYNKISNQRFDFLHKLSRKLINQFGSIAVEDLQVKNMVRNHYLAKGISDASWGTFVRMLEYKAVTSGSTITKVNPRNTSKTCSSCGTINEMPLSKREFLCSNCGFACHRDHNASINILNGTAGLAETSSNACGDSTSTTEQSAASGVIEAGTISGK